MIASTACALPKVLATSQKCSQGLSSLCSALQPQRCRGRLRRGRLHSYNCPGGREWRGSASNNARAKKTASHFPSVLRSLGPKIRHSALVYAPPSVIDKKGHCRSRTPNSRRWSLATRTAGPKLLPSVMLACLAPSRRRAGARNWRRGTATPGKRSRATGTSDRRISAASPARPTTCGRLRGFSTRLSITGNQTGRSSTCFLYRISLCRTRGSCSRWTATNLMEILRWKLTIEIAARFAI